MEMQDTRKEIGFSGEKPNNVDNHSELEIRKIENRETTNAKPRAMEKFLDSLSNGTKKSYRRGLELFIEFYGKPIETILEERKDDLTSRPNENLVSIHTENVYSRHQTPFFLAFQNRFSCTCSLCRSVLSLHHSQAFPHWQVFLLNQYA